MANLLRFNGRVALVTGAGGGLGKEYALLLASRGAKVVVNDLGGGIHGEGQASRPADEVVHLIKSKGGTAVPNYDSVVDGDKLVKTAIDNFGRLDIVVNNAGILRDRTLARMSDTDWDLVHKVHLRGTFAVTRAAFPYMKKQNYGRIVNTSSPSGLYGNFGQANYASAKMGIVGFSSTVAKEGAKYNILCNTIAPQAWSRMTAELLPPNMEEFMKAQHLAPVVSYLCHESFPESGSVIESFGGWVSKVCMESSHGVVLPKNFNIEDVEKNWSKICDMSNSHHHSGAAEVTGPVLERIQSGEGASTSDSSTGHDVATGTFQYSHRDAILYALSIGCNLTQTDTSDLKYLYEGHEDFSIIPTFGVIAAQGIVMNGSAMSAMRKDGPDTLKNFSLAQALHGEQYMELKSPLPPSGTLITEGKVVEVLDKKSGALVAINCVTKTESGEVVAENQFITFIIGAGGFGGKKTSDKLKVIEPTPNRPPDATLSTKTASSQAALYRLNGDYNPLHVDANFAKIGGFQTPILHGLCSYGIATHHILREFANDDVSKFKAIKARFSKPVLPGETIQTDMWKEGNRIHFVCKVVETGKECLSGGYVDLHDTVEKAAGTSADISGLKSSTVFEQIKAHVAANPDLVGKVKAIFGFKITQNGKTAATWTVDLKNGFGSVYTGESEQGKAGCILTLSDDDMVDMVTGKLDGQKAFFQGKLKVSGDVMLSQKLKTIFPSNKPKL